MLTGLVRGKNHAIGISINSVHYNSQQAQSPTRMGKSDLLTGGVINGMKDGDSLQYLVILSLFPPTYRYYGTVAKSCLQIGQNVLSFGIKRAGEVKSQYAHGTRYYRYHTTHQENGNWNIPIGPRILAL